MEFKDLFFRCDTFSKLHEQTFEALYIDLGANVDFSITVAVRKWMLNTQRLV